MSEQPDTTLKNAWSNKTVPFLQSNIVIDRTNTQSFWLIEQILRYVPEIFDANMRRMVSTSDAPPNINSLYIFPALFVIYMYNNVLSRICSYPDILSSTNDFEKYRVFDVFSRLRWLALLSSQRIF